MHWKYLHNKNCKAVSECFLKNICPQHMLGRDYIEKGWNVHLII